MGLVVTEDDNDGDATCWMFDQLVNNYTVEKETVWANCIVKSLVEYITPPTFFMGSPLCSSKFMNETLEKKENVLVLEQKNRSISIVSRFTLFCSPIPSALVNTAYCTQLCCICPREC